MIDKLNAPQREAVTLAAQHALVLAGAGSGKTRVLTTRMAWLIQTGQVSPQGLLAVTFTNKAALEMLARVSAILPIDPRGLWIGTFHGLCNRMLRAHHRDAGLPQAFQILDTADQLAAIKRLLKANAIDDEKYPPRDVQRFINGAKEEGQRPGDVEAFDSFRRRMIEIYTLYEAQCQREGVVDFPELEGEAELVAGGGAVGGVEPLRQELAGVGVRVLEQLRGLLAILRRDDGVLVELPPPFGPGRRTTDPVDGVPATVADGQPPDPGGARRGLLGAEGRPRRVARRRRTP